MFIPLKIRFINVSENVSKDDVLTINKLDNTSFQWIFKDSNDAKTHTLSLSPAYAVSDRLYTMLKLFAADSSPAAELQVDAPGFPTVLFKASQISENISLICESVNHVLDAWPMSYVRDSDCCPKATDHTHCDATVNGTRCDATYETPRWTRKDGRLHAVDSDLPPLTPISYETPARGKHLFFD
jgi:hypothetical protein